jgi:hypothetical protein
MYAKSLGLIPNPEKHSVFFSKTHPITSKANPIYQGKITFIAILFIFSCTTLCAS